jgi:hypothetical protein
LFRKNLPWVLTLSTLLVGAWALGNSFVTPGVAQSQNGLNVYLPILFQEAPSPTPGTTPIPILLGFYPSDYWQPMVQDAMDKEFHPLDTWAGKHHSLAGIFHYFNQPATVNGMLSTIWNNGYTPFVNMFSYQSAASIAQGGEDVNIHAWAKDFKLYAQNGARMAFLAPLQEMNWCGSGDVPYSCDPANFKLAYQRVQQIFAQEGVPASSVRWVFAPNGYSRSQDPPFEDYYPSGSIVDVVAFSSYNFGYHPSNPYKDWLSPTETFTSYLDRIRIMAPSKPIFIGQAGTTGYYADGYNTGQKNLWLKNAYILLANYYGVRGVLYYNANVTYDWAFWTSSGTAFQGYRDGIANPAFGYIAPDVLKNLDLTVP